MQESMVDWNPLLVALAVDKIRVVHYFLRNCKVALKEAGRRPIPRDAERYYEDEMAKY